MFYASVLLTHTGIPVLQDLMKQHQVDAEDMLLRLREKFGDIVKNVKKQPMGQIFFCYRYST